jgi:hypothetical protein
VQGANSDNGLTAHAVRKAARRLFSDFNQVLA